MSSIPPPGYYSRSSFGDRPLPGLPIDSLNSFQPAPESPYEQYKGQYKKRRPKSQSPLRKSPVDKANKMKSVPPRPPTSSAFSASPSRSQSPPLSKPLPTGNSGSSASSTSLNKDDSNDSDSDYDDRDLWDAGGLVPWEDPSPSDTFLPCLKALKFAVYCILFITILVGTVVTQACLLLLTASLAKVGESVQYRENIIQQLLLITCAPHVLVFILSLLKASFGNVSWPSIAQFIAILVLELMHTFGLTLLIFRVLSSFDSLYALGLMHVLGILPLLVKIIFARRAHGDVRGKVTCALTLIADVICLAIQLGAVGLSVYLVMQQGSDRSLSDRWATTNSTVTSDDGFYERDVQRLLWQIPVAIVLVSVKWWENFVDTDRGCLRLFAFKRLCKDTRTKMDCVTSLVAIVATVGFIYLFDFLDGRSVSTSLIFGGNSPMNETTQHRLMTTMSPLFSISVNISSTPSPIVVTFPTINWQVLVGVVQVLAALITYFATSLACKLLMQRVSFCLPVYLATPCLVTLICLQCSGFIPNLPLLGGLQYEMICPASYVNHWLQLVAAACYWISTLWLSGYIWFPRAERLAFSEKLFVRALYSGPIVVPSLLLNRRRMDGELSRTGSYSTSNNNSGSSNNSGFISSLEDPDSGITASTGLEDAVDSQVDDVDGSNKQPVPMIYACATMWHEEEDEMKAFFKSIFRLDKDQCIRKLARDTFHINDPDYYEFEGHIFFDDAMELSDDDKWVVNKYVLKISNCLHEAASLVTKEQKEMPPPTRVITPYGGRLTWILPGGNNLIVHLKDKNKIRHRKRWSQIMYMYYLLGYKLFDEEQALVVDSGTSSGGFHKPQDGRKQSTESVTKSTLSSRDDKDGSGNDDGPQTRDVLSQAQSTFGYFVKSQRLNNMDEAFLAKAANTFILALDGDVDFKPDAVRLLVDSMKRNPKTGAACGRIHPTGSGPMVWYQLFEYAIGHWFQKATEHVLGCVLCSPGCFSLFRGLSLLDDNVMKMYTRNVEKATDYLQCEQGEDRWLCTLLLKQGYRVDYTAAADALTHAPEGFDEFFNQRRRWMPSTMANIMDLLGDWQTTVYVNDNISYLYILYQFILMISCIIGPATIILAIAQALMTVLGCDIFLGYGLSLGPVIGYIFVCFYFKQKTQLFVAKILCAIYALVMLAVFVGTIHAIVSAKNMDPSFIFLALLVCSFLLAGILHPYEFYCLTHGLLYFLSVPAGYLVLVIYSLSNMNCVAWGTREVPKRKTPAELQAEEEKKESEKKKKKKGWCSFFNLQSIIAEIKEFIVQLIPAQAQRDHVVKQETNDSIKIQMAILSKLTEVLRVMKGDRSGNNEECELEHIQQEVDTLVAVTIHPSSSPALHPSSSPALPPPIPPHPPQSSAIVASSSEIHVDDIDNPDWIEFSEDLGNGKVVRLSKHEKKFWIGLIDKYLKPLDKNKKHEEEMKQKLEELRTSSSMAFWFINLVWVLLSFMVNKDNALNTVSFNIAGTEFSTQPFGFIFLIFFVIVLILQLIAMIIHRWGTFMQLISITELRRPGWRSNAQIKRNDVKDAIDIITDMVNREREECFDEPPTAYQGEGEVNRGHNNHYDRYYGQTSPKELFRTVRDRYCSRDKSTWHSKDHRRQRGRISYNDARKPRALENNYNNPQRRRQPSEGQGHEYGRRNERQGDSYGYRGQGRGRDDNGYERDRRRYAADNYFADNFRRHLGTVMGQRERRNYY